MTTNECDCGNWELDPTGHVLCYDCRREYLQKVRENNLAAARRERESERPRVQHPEAKYIHTEKGLVMRCPGLPHKGHFGRCNAHTLLREMVNRTIMVQMPKKGYEEEFYTASPAGRADIPSHTLPRDVSICPNCAAELDSKGGKVWASNATPPDNSVEREQEHQAPPSTLKSFWAGKAGKVVVSCSDTISPGAAQKDFFWQLVRRQG